MLRTSPRRSPPPKRLCFSRRAAAVAAMPTVLVISMVLVSVPAVLIGPVPVPSVPAAAVFHHGAVFRNVIKKGSLGGFYDNGVFVDKKRAVCGKINFTCGGTTADGGFRRGKFPNGLAAAVKNSTAGKIKFSVFVYNAAADVRHKNKPA